MTTLQTGSARQRIMAYEAEMNAYAKAHQDALRGTPQYNPSPWDLVSGNASGPIGPSEDYHTPEQDWVASLPPDVKADYYASSKEVQAENIRKMRMDFAKAVAIAATAGAGGAALGLGEAAGALGGAEAAGALGGAEAVGGGLGSAVGGGLNLGGATAGAGLGMGGSAGSGLLVGGTDAALGGGLLGGGGSLLGGAGAGAGSVFGGAGTALGAGGALSGLGGAGAGFASGIGSSIPAGSAVGLGDIGGSAALGQTVGGSPLDGVDPNANPTDSRLGNNTQTTPMNPVDPSTGLPKIPSVPGTGGGDAGGTDLSSLLRMGTGAAGIASVLKGLTNNAKLPDIPNYTDLAEKTAASKNAQVDKQTLLNRPNQTNAQGDTTQWTIDPVTGQSVQKTAFGGANQAAYDQSQALMTALRGKASGNLATGNNPAIDVMNPVGNATEIQDAYMKLQQPGLDRQRAAYIQRLRSQGVPENSVIMQNAMRTQGNVETDASLKGLLAGTTEYGNQFQRSLQGNNQQFNQNRVTGQDVYTNMEQVHGQMPGNPTFTPVTNAAGGSGVDYSGAGTETYNGLLGNYNAEAAKNTGLLTGGGQLLQGAYGAYNPSGGSTPSGKSAPSLGGDLTGLVGGIGNVAKTVGGWFGP